MASPPVELSASTIPMDAQALLKLISSLRERPEEEIRQDFVDEIDIALTANAVDDDPQITSCYRQFSQLCSRAHLLPTSFFLGDGLHCESGDISHSPYFELYRASHHGQCVALKVFRVRNAENAGILRKALHKELVLWKYLSHRNIVPYLGVWSSNPCSLVSKWMINGTIMEYLEHHPGADRIRLSIQIAQGLKYLHSRGVVHGDLKGATVSIDADGVARLAEFGIATVTDDQEQNFATPHTEGSLRWMAPELLDYDTDGLFTIWTDMYAFGMVLWQIFTGLLPFHTAPNHMAIMRQVTDGIRPQMPNPNTIVVPPSVSDLMETCWQNTPQDRGSPAFAIELLERSQ